MRRVHCLTLGLVLVAVGAPTPAHAQKDKKGQVKHETKKEKREREKKEKKEKEEKEKEKALAKSGHIKARVVDVAGGRAYIEPGGKAGLRVGDTISFDDHPYKIIAVSPGSVVVEMGDKPLKRDATGTSTIDPNRAEPHIEPVSKPVPLAAYRGTWPEAVIPATQQHPKPVPLGPVTRAERNSLVVGVDGSAVIPTGGVGSGYGFAELRGIVHYEPYTEAPFGLDADLSLQNWFGGNLAAESNDSRPNVRIRAMQASYGNEGAFLAALGRMRYASSTVGPLDGVRVRAPLFGGVWLGAFGGLIANPLSDLPATQASRFGGEIGVEDAMAEWRPRFVIGGHASRFAGALDERQLDALFDLNPDFGRFGAFAQASFFDKGNPWNASTTELSAAGADASVRAGVLEVGGRFAMQRPERSRYLASFLPPEWLCVERVALTPQGACFGNEATFMGSSDIGLHFPKVVTVVGGNYSATVHANAEQLGGFGDLRLLDLIGRFRIDTGVMGSRGTFLQTAAWSISPGIVAFDGAADISLRYRPALIRYSASTRRFIEHSIGGAVWLSPSAYFDLTFDADYVRGDDFNALLMQTAMAWRTGF